MEFCPDAKIEPATIDGVKVYRLTPATIPARNASARSSMGMAAATR
ncbi:MAG TPA: hypothetical protein VL356_09495 [Acidocella sp.]|nr:hypothetical protein [Acidocella sp.]